MAKETTVWCKSSHRIKMTEKINREAKERHAAERHGLKFELHPGRDKPK
jgi:hypothetical protein